MVERYDLIVGVFSGMGNVTLIDCQYYGGTYGDFIDVARFSVKYLLKGVSIDTFNDLAFDRCKICFPSLIEWFEKSTIDIKRQENKRFLSVETPPDIELLQFNDVIFYLGFGHSIFTHRGEVNIKEKLFYKIKSIEKRISFFSFLSYISNFRKFLIFNANLSPESENVLFYRDDIVCDPKIPQLNKPIAIELLIGFSQTKQDLSFYTPSIKYGQVEKILPEMYREWLTNSNLSNCVDLLLEKSYNQQLSTENYFLNSCFSIETFHRRFRNFEIFKKADFKKLKAKIKSVIEDPEIYKFIDEKLAHANEPSFKSRLLDIKADFDKLLPDHYELEEYIRKIVKTRNFLVHRSSEKGIIKGLELFYAAKYIDTIVKINVFRLIGINEDIIDHELLQSKDYIHQMYLQNKRLQESLKDEIV